MSLIPEIGGGTPNYWCTWDVQNSEFDPVPNPGTEAGKLMFEGDQGARMARHNLNETTRFGPHGWTANWPAVRRDLYFMLDDGWDVPYHVHPDTQVHRFGSLELNEERFPSCTGTPAERLRKMNAKLQAAGWRGAGLWVAAQAVGDGLNGQKMDDAGLGEYWRERLRWSRDAGIQYWKVDWGFRAHDPEFRRWLTALAGEIAPGLLVEHGTCCLPLNGVVMREDKVLQGNGRFCQPDDTQAKAVRLLAFSDVVRVYDTIAPLATVSTLDRAVCFLQQGKPSAHSRGLVNVEDEVYLGAVLGCCLGIMRAPRRKTPPYDGVARCNQRLTEVVRAVRWQRLAPAYGVGENELCVSPNTLRDTWEFTTGSTWWSAVIGKTVSQAAPAVVARGCALPAVHVSAGEAPFVVASRHPNGAVAVATLPRVSNERGLYTPPADVAIAIDGSPAPIGVFGHYNSLALDAPAGWSAARVWAQDLALDEAVDITGQVIREGRRLILPGDLIRHLGKPAANDLSAPGIVVMVQA